MKLHLGCGQRYFDGYVNIDYPMTEHSVQEKSVADIQADLLKLKYDRESIEEVRLHHVFEHFSRPVACALLSNWYLWLKNDGVLHIEVPDFERTAKAALSTFKSQKMKRVALRHIFGSQEAHWAVHFEGYSENLLTTLLELFGFHIVKVKKNSWKGTYNIEVLAQKKDVSRSVGDMENSARLYLSKYLVDEGESERRLLETYMKIYRNHLIF
ncbi:MAG: hypothetical protein IT223_09300 [Crocinitomicaceae bacterium]|nr:hypothetical protein [Crocinitomicaceae bacterium]